MIIQCEKCRTRFKLDDSRVTEAGIRVRCSRCSHTFVVRRDSPEDETDFETILQGLGENESYGEDTEKESPEGEISADQTMAGSVSSVSEEFGEEDAASAEDLADGDVTADSLSGDEDTQDSPVTEFPGKGVGLPHFQVAPDLDSSEKVLQAKDTDEDSGLAGLFETSPVQCTRHDEVSGESVAIPPGEPNLGSATAADPEKSEPSRSIREHLWPVADAKDEDGAEDDLSPLSITSRRKGSPFMPILLGILLVLLLGGAGYYLFSSGSGNLTAMLPESAKAVLGLGGKSGGLVEIRSLEGTFLKNKDAGEIFVIRGEAFNVSPKPLTTIQVKGKVYGPKGDILVQRTVFCGNVLSGEQLAMQPYSSMVKALGKQFGETLANFQVQPGKGVPFVIVFRDVPKGGKDFGAEVISPLGSNIR